VTPGGESRTLDRLWSVHEIQQLACRYALAHDSRDMAMLDTLFVDAREPLDWPSFNIENLRRSLPVGLKHAGPSILLVGNHIVELQDDERATGSVYCLARLAVGGGWVEQAIIYFDSYRRVDGTWLIDQRRHLLWYGVELDERPFDQPKTTWPVSPVGRGSLPEDFPAWRAFHGISELPTGFYASPTADESYHEYDNNGSGTSATAEGE
jgi:hypothetical protein